MTPPDQSRDVALIGEVNARTVAGAARPLRWTSPDHASRLLATVAGDWRSSSTDGPARYATARCAERTIRTARPYAWQAIVVFGCGGDRDKQASAHGRDRRRGGLRDRNERHPARRSDAIIDDRGWKARIEAERVTDRRPQSGGHRHGRGRGQVLLAGKGMRLSDPRNDVVPFDEKEI